MVTGIICLIIGVIFFYFSGYLRKKSIPERESFMGALVDGMLDLIGMIFGTPPTLAEYRGWSIILWIVGLVMSFVGIFFIIGFLFAEATGFDN